ncbi:MAG: DUF3396 domain-containing protein [Myxococcales bacterium]|nr:DUF3396 domain-containing protein [Myxococcales bacterium]
MGSIDELIAQATSRLAPCIVLSLYTREATAEMREGVVAVYEDYVRRWGECLRWSADGDTERYRKFDESTAAYPRRALERYSERKHRDIYWVAYGGAHRHDASAWKFYAKLSSQYYAGTTVDHASASWEIGAVTAPEILAVALDWTKRFSVWQGYAGYSLGVSEEHEQSTAATVHHLAMRFQGLEIHYPGATASCCRTELKGVNWLTLVSHVLLEELGGEATLRAKLSAEIRLHPIRDGVLIQAGPEPLLGDVNRGETLPLYREVAKVLKPIRAETHWPFFGILTANDWMTRFDR